MIYLDVTRTIEDGALTGIQRVVLEYLRELGKNSEVQAVRKKGRDWLLLDARNTQKLLQRGKRGNLKEERRGNSNINVWRWRLFAPKAAIKENDTLLLLETFTETPRVNSPNVKTVAMVHDLSAINHPEWSAKKTQESFPRYLCAAATCSDVIVPSEFTKKELLAFWAAQKLEAHPVVTVVEHGVALPPENFENKPSPTKRLLCLGTLEARKNHLSLLKACELLWEAGEKFELVIVGAKAKSGKAAKKEIKRLTKLGRGVIFKKAIGDAELEAEWTKAWAFVYPSYEEGFGLPVAEALARGVPVICGVGGALQERVRFGGCEPLREVDPDSLMLGIKNVLREERRAELAAEAKDAPIRTWAEAATEALEVIKN